MHSFGETEHCVDSDGVRNWFFELGECFENGLVDFDLSAATEQIEQRNKVVHSKQLVEVHVIGQDLLYDGLELLLHFCEFSVHIDVLDNIAQQNIRFSRLCEC